MLAQFQVLFILFITFYIGWRVGKELPDEIIPARKYLAWGIHALLVAAIGIAFYGFGWKIAAFVAVPALLLLRIVVPFKYAYEPASGVLLGFAFLLPLSCQIAVAVLLLAMNFLLGATTHKIRELTHAGARQLILAAAILIAMQFV